MRPTLLIISAILLIACIFSLYNMKPTEMNVIIQEPSNLNIDTCIFDLDSMERRMLYDEEHERMVRDSLDRISDGRTGTTQGDSI